MTEAERNKIKEAIKNDVKLSKAYKDLLDAKRKGKLRKEIKPEDIMVNLVAQYGSNAAGLVEAALSRPAVVMEKCKQKYAASSGTLKYLVSGKATDKQVAAVLGKTEAKVRKDKELKGTTLPATREGLKTQQSEAKVNQRVDDKTQSKTKTSSKSKTKTAQDNAEAKPAAAAPAVNIPKVYEMETPVWEDKFTKDLKEKEKAKKREEELQNLYDKCHPVVSTSATTDIKTLMEKGLVTQADIQAYYDKNGKEFVEGISAGQKGKKLAKDAYNHAAGHRCVGGCLSGVQSVNPDVPWANDPAWDEYTRPGQEDNWACDTYKMLEKSGYITVTVPNESTGRESPGAKKLRTTIAKFPEGTTVSFDNQIDSQATKQEDYHGLIRRTTNPSKRCGHVATVTARGLCSDGFQPHNNGYDPTNYGDNVHLSLPADTQVSEELAKELIKLAYERREQTAEAQKIADQYILRNNGR